MARLVLSDASPLIALAMVDGLEWLPALFGPVHVPGEVRREVLTGRHLPGEAQIQQAFEAAWLRPWEAPVLDFPLPDLDEGEAACIRVALAADEPALLLMDERAGRAVAVERGLRVAATAAVIGLACKRGLIPSARAVFERLHRSDFRISAAAIHTVLAEVGE